jgi:hypothetical protein
MCTLIERRGNVYRVLIAVCALAALLGAGSALAQSAVEMEELGFSPDPVTLPVPDPHARELAGAMLPTTGLLLIPESSNDRVMAFDPLTGDLIDPDFIPADPTNLSTPIQAILAADGQSILVSDQLDDVVQQYDLTGAYIGVFAPAGGADTSILNNIRGIALRPNGNLLVTVGSAPNDDSVAEFDTSGNYLGNFVAIGSGGLGSPFDVSEVTLGGGVLSPGEWLVGGINSDAIHRYDATGAPLANLAPMNTFPEQVTQIANGNVLVGNFSGTQEGVVELDSNGMVVGIYDPPSLGGYRGAYELPNGNILTTNGGGVHEIDRMGNLVETKIGGVSARFITFVGGEPEPPKVIPTLSQATLALLVLLLAAAAVVVLRRRRTV